MARRKRTLQKAREIQERTDADVLKDYQAGSLEYYVAKFFYSLRSNIRYVLIVGGVILLAGSGALGYWAYLVSRENKSLAAFETLRRDPVLQASTEDARKLAIEKLDEYAKKYDLIDSAGYRANLKKIEILRDAGRNEEAAEVSREMARQIELPELRAYFYLQSAVLFENAGKLPNAQEGYERASEFILENNEIKAFALFGQGRCLYLLGRERDARAAMEALLELDGEGDFDRYRLQAAAFLAARRK